MFDINKCTVSMFFLQTCKKSILILIFSSECTCGETLTERITNGMTAKDNEFPFHVRN